MYTFKNKKADEARRKTYKDMMRLIEEDRKAAVIRPTGFGKTGLLTELIKSKRFLNILYVYPTEVIKNTVLAFYYEGEDNIPEDRAIPGVTFMTNAKFSRLDEKELMEIGYGYEAIILDECHKIGGEKTGENLDKLVDCFPDLVLIGATATPERMDAKDVIGRYFGESRVYEYNIHDAFNDGILQRPRYIYCEYARPKDNLEIIKGEWKTELDLVDDKRLKLILAEDLETKSKEIARIYNMERAIKRNCDKFVDTSYMKFIVFFPRFEALHKQKNKVKSWFRKAYPDHKIKELIIISETPEYSANVKELSNLTYRKNGIDLIYAVDMLNMGYHVDNLTGIVMYRGTESNIIYVQELGRVLSTGTNKNAIVFDVVDNLHNRALYEALGKESIYTKNARDRLLQLEQKAEMWSQFTKSFKVEVSTEDLRKTTAVRVGLERTYKSMKEQSKSEAELSRIKKELEKAVSAEEEMQRKYNEADEAAREFFDGKPLEAVEFTKKDQTEYNALYRRFNQKKEQDDVERRNRIWPEDLIVVDESATYRELIKKLVAEPRAARANQAWQDYLESGGKYRTEDGTYYTSKEQFLELVSPEDCPLAMFCKPKHVTPEDVLVYVLGFPPEEKDKHKYPAFEKVIAAKDADADSEAV